MHRVHTEPSQCSVTYNTHQQLACPHCEEMFETTSKVNEHMNNNHPDGFESLNHITLDSNIDCSRYELLKCKECNKLFYYESDIETHVTTVHKFGEYWNPYPCEECGFKGSNVVDIEEHQQNHKDLGTKNLTALKSLMAI